jgi:hypothetical protein
MGKKYESFKDGIYEIQADKLHLTKLKQTIELRVLDFKGNHILTFRNIEHYITERKAK